MIDSEQILLLPVDAIEGGGGDLDCNCSSISAISSDSGSREESRNGAEVATQAWPSVTVVICCYSGEAFFEATVNSVQRQTYPNFRIVLHDNGCGPTYRSKIMQTANRIGAELIRSDVNRYGEGLRYDVLPTLVGDFVAILHDDDVYTPEKLELSLRAIVDDGLDYVFTDRQYINEIGQSISGHPEGVNTNAILPGDFPYKMAMEIFHGGLRLHFSTLVIRTELAKNYLLGDPFVPRIADALFFAELLLDRTALGSFIDDKLTLVRVHGQNDFLYSKFSGKERARQEYKLSISEYFVFQRIIFLADDEQLGRCLECFPGVSVQGGDTRTEILVKAGLLLKAWPRAKKLMAAFCLHEAFRIDARGMMEIVRFLKAESSGDANAELTDIYDRYVADEFTLFGIGKEKHIVVAGTDAEVRRYLDEVLDSNSWKVTSPIRAIIVALRKFFN